MHVSPRWTAAVAAAALIALPGSALAQTPPPQNPPAQPPTQTQPQTQPPASPQASSPAAPQVDAAAAKQHLTEARESLSQLTSMPEAAKLQGDTRSKVAELISNFNALITTQADWRASYGKVTDSLNALLGPDADQAAQAAGTTGTATSGTAGATGTTGTTPAPGATAGAPLNPALRAKLVEFRTHLNEFEKAAGGAAPPLAPNPETASKPETAPSSMPPAAATASTSNPANPAPASNPTTNPPASNPSASAAAGTTGTTGTASSAGNDAGTNAVAQSELAAIDAILAQSKTGALTKAQTDELKRHIEALHSLLK